MPALSRRAPLHSWEIHLETAPQPPNPINAVSTTRSGLLFLVIGINALWGTQIHHSIPLLIAGLIIGFGAIFGAFCILMYSTKFWLQYIHDYVDYRLAQQSTQPPPAT